MGLRGNLETFLLTSILQLIHNDRKTGALQVRNDEDWVNVIIQNGAIVYAMGSNRHARLGNLLRAQGMITLEQLQVCLAEGKVKKQALGKILVDKGFLSVDQLKQFIRSQVEEIIYSLFLWNRGNFQYKDAKLNLSGLVATNLDIMEVLLEASRRIDEMSVLEKQIPSNNTVFKPTNNAKKKNETRLVTDEWDALSIVDGKRTVSQVMEETGMDKFMTYKILHSLISSGLIEKTDILVRVQDQGSLSGVDDYSSIIMGYYNILQIIWQKLEPEIGQEASVLLEYSKPEAVPGQKDLFRNFHPGNPAPENIHAVQENLGVFDNIKNERLFLVESFNRFILNILDKVPEILGVAPTRDMLWAIQNVLPYITKYMKDMDIDRSLADDVKRILDKIEVQISSGKVGKQKSGSILSMFKKK
ncbi:MAG: DUF4388 domain-containing protein [bacterium]|nr:DUF4388 domain-containing protein [bacterium]